MASFGANSTTDDVLEGVDLRGRRVFVTGASTGLGEETARSIASHGAAVTMAVRDLDRGGAAVERIRTTVPAADLEVRELELASLASVRACAAGFLADHDRLDVLVNNAGVMACPFGTTADGFELQFGTNHLGHFLLANLLAPALVAAAPARVVSLSSRGHRFSDMDLDDPTSNARRTSRGSATGGRRPPTSCSQSSSITVSPIAVCVPLPCTPDRSEPSWAAISPTRACPPSSPRCRPGRR